MSFKRTGESHVGELAILPVVRSENTKVPSAFPPPTLCQGPPLPPPPPTPFPLNSSLPHSRVSSVLAKHTGSLSHPPSLSSYLALLLSRSLCFLPVRATTRTAARPGSRSCLTAMADLQKGVSENKTMRGMVKVARATTTQKATCVSYVMSIQLQHPGEGY